MTPAGHGVIHGHVDDDPAEIRVIGAWRTDETTVAVQEHFGTGSYVCARIVLDEEGRRELIMMLGGTP